MSYGGGYQGGRTRMGTKIILNVYDLAPANEFLYPIGFGLHHSGVEILGTEYSFASGGGVFESTPKEAPGAQFREAIEMGVLDGGQSEVQSAISELRDSFGPDDYNLIRKNCNHFSNALVWKLLGRTIPGHVNRLADFGVCCSCLLPKKLLEEAPVGDPNAASRSSSSGGGGSVFRSASQPSATVPSFSGSGARLGGANESSSTAGLSTRLFGSTPATSRQDELSHRREKAKLAALARMERAQLDEGRASDTDKSR